MEHKSNVLSSNEVWRKIDSIPQEFYEISSEGNCRSIDHYGWSRHRIGLNRLFKGKPLRGDIGNYGKVRYQLGKKKIFAHILVAKAFPEICGKWFKGCEVHHIDYDPSNNKASNLIVLSKEEHRKLHKALGKNKGVNNAFYGKKHPKELIEQIASKNRIEVSQYTMDGEFIRKIKGVKIAAESVGGNANSLIRCLKGRCEHYKGFKWSY